jgi:signal transduction histidine kinase
MLNRSSLFATSFPLCIAVPCVLIALSSLLGWTFGIETMTSVFAGYPSMAPITAMLTLLAAGALAQDATPIKPSHRQLAPALLIGAALAVLSIHGGAQWADVPYPAAGRTSAWRMPSPLTATMFFATGISLLALPAPRYVYHAQWLALGVLFLALLTLSGYLFQGTYLYQTLPGTGTSILTTVALVLLALGCLGMRPRAGIMAAVTGATHGAQVARRLLAAAAAWPVALGAVVWSALHFGVIDAGTGIALLVWGIAAMIVVVSWVGAVRLHRVDNARSAAEQALEAALAALREADANKDRFLAVLAHELRNPLAPIKAAADLLLLSAAADLTRQQRAGAIIVRQVATMNSLVEDLLDLSRVRQGLLFAASVPVDLQLVVQDALEQTMPLVTQRRHHLHSALPDRHPMVYGDHKRLVQVVANLLVNAAKYTPEGGTITLALRMDDMAEISIADDGIGIEAGMLGQIFDAFTQAERTPARVVGGLGIGLALVKSLINLHGGTITAHSAGLGRGSRFVVRLPAVPATAPPPPAPAAP